MNEYLDEWQYNRKDKSLILRNFFFLLVLVFVLNPAKISRTQKKIQILVLENFLRSSSTTLYPFNVILIQRKLIKDGVAFASSNNGYVVASTYVSERF